jgi:hypothetical protein
VFPLGRVAEIVPFFIITLQDSSLLWDKGMGQAELSYAPETMGQSILSHTVVPLKSIGMTTIPLMGQDMHPLPVRGLLYKTY